MKRLFLFVVLAGLFFYLTMPSIGQPANQAPDSSPSLVPVAAQDPDAKNLKDRLDQLEAKFEQLKKENDKLKKDLELLKGELANGKGVKGPGEDKAMNPKATYRGIDYELAKCTRNGATVKLTFLLLSPKTDANAVFGGLSAIDNEGAIFQRSAERTSQDARTQTRSASRQAWPSLDAAAGTN